MRMSIEVVRRVASELFSSELVDEPFVFLMRRMGWFMGVLFFGVLGTLIYGLAGPETQISNEAMGTFLVRSYKNTKRTMGL